jgi:hypothetical protein
VARIVSTLEADDDIGLLGQPVDDFPLPFVPPLGTYHDHIGHEAPFLHADGASKAVGHKAAGIELLPGNKGSCPTRQDNEARDILVLPAKCLISRVLRTPTIAWPAKRTIPLSARQSRGNIAAARLVGLLLLWCPEPKKIRPV